MSRELDELDRRFSIANGPCRSLITGKVQEVTEHSKEGWADHQRKNAKGPRGKRLEKSVDDLTMLASNRH